jgi:predicted TIM-barrel fold metal-dependent hydrolase
MAPSAIREIPIIDVDTHYNEPHDLWTSRAPASLRDRVPRVKNVNGIDSWVVERDAVLFPYSGVCVIRRDGSKMYGELSLRNFDEMHPGATDPRARLAWMDAQGIQAQVIYPNLIGFVIEAFLTRISDPQLREFCIRAWNDYMGEVQAIGAGRLFPQALVPFWDPKLAVREAIRAHEELGMTGLNLPSGADACGVPSLSHPSYDPLWEVAQDRGMSINFHIGGGGVNVKPWDMVSPSAHAASLTTSSISSNIRCLTNLIFSGLLDRFPNLNFVSVESGVGWIPFLLELCEYQYDENRVTGLQLRPKEYFRRQIYAAYWFEQDPTAAIERIGTDNLMFETDFPHPTCLYPGIHEQIERSLGHVTPESRRKILCDTAARVYHVPLPAV